MACFKVPSKTGSPVVLTKSASRMESFSVRGFPLRECQYNPPPAKAAITTTPATARSHVGVDALVRPDERSSSASKLAGTTAGEAESDEELLATRVPDDPETMPADAEKET